MTTQHIKYIGYFLGLLGITLGLNACGFHLRGQNCLSRSLPAIYLQTNHPQGSLESMLRNTLRTCGMVLKNSPDAAPITLQLVNMTQTNNNVAIGPSSGIRVYTLSYQIMFELKNTQGKILLGPRTITASRNLNLSANQLVQSNNQVDVLNREIERDIVDQLYNILSSEQVIQVLSKP